VYDRAKGWQMDSRDFPKLPVVKALVLVTQYVSDANDRFPWSISMPFQKLPRQCTGSLGNNLRSAFYGAPMQVASLILFEREPLNDGSDAIDLVTNVQQSSARILARCH
jgi:hypothetical protein